MALSGTAPASNAVPAGKRLRDLLNTALADQRDLAVTYGWPGRDLPSEAVWIGKATGPHDHLASRAGGTRPRREQITIEVHVEVMVTGGTTEDAADRAAQIGAEVERVLANNMTLAGLPGVTQAVVTTMEQDSGWADDESTASHITYQVLVDSILQ